jgi:Ca2+:H+ antiporter
MAPGLRTRRSAAASDGTTDASMPLLSSNSLHTNAAHHHISHPLHLLREILFSSYVNVLLVFLPLGIVSGALGWSSILTFVFNFLAIMALASLLSFATEELSMEVGETIGGLLNASFGNATELIISIVALKEGQIKLVQASMLGSILSNLLLVCSSPVSRTPLFLPRSQSRSYFVCS